MPAGRQAAQGVEGVAVVAQLAGDVRGDVHDVAVALDHHHVGDLDRAELGDAADVVAAQVDEHDVLGPFLGVGQQFGGELRRLLRRCCRGGACRRAGGRSTLPSTTRTMISGELPTSVHAGHAQVEHERAGVHDPQRAVELERRHVEVDLQPLADHDLKDVAGADVLDALADRLLRTRPA